MAGGIVKRGDVWRARYRGPGGRLGVQRERVFRRKLDAQRWLDEQNAQHVTGTYVDPARGRVSVAEAAGLAGLTPHELRHTAASLAVSAGANVKAVQRMLGHARAAMTLDVYADLFDDDLEAVAERLDALARASAGVSISGTRATLADRFLPDVIVIRRSYVGGVPSGWRRRRVPWSGRDGSDAPG
jgi:Phage integrase family